MKRDEAHTLLPEYALGALNDEERRGVEAWLDDPGLRAELQEIEDGLTAVADSQPPVAPSPDARARLLAAASGPDRYSAVMPDIARVCDLSLEQVRQVLRRIDDATAWLAGPMPGITIQHFDHGPAAAGADTGFVRYPPNMVFPQHRHLGQETTIVLDGQFTDHDGRVYEPGDVLVYDENTAHHFTVGPEGVTIVICFSGYEPL